MYPKTVFHDSTDMDSLPREAIPQEAELITGNSRSKIPQPSSPHARKLANKSSNDENPHDDRGEASGTKKDNKVEIRASTVAPVFEASSSFEKIDSVGSSKKDFKNENEKENESPEQDSTFFESDSDEKTVGEEVESGNGKKVSKSRDGEEEDEESDSDQHPSFDWISSWSFLNCICLQRSVESIEIR